MPNGSSDSPRPPGSPAISPRAPGRRSAPRPRSALACRPLKRRRDESLAGPAPPRRRHAVAPAEVVERVRVAEHFGGRAPAVGQVEPPVAELVEVEEPDDLPPGAEGHERDTAETADA